MKVGIGWDIHKIVDGCCLILGGVIVSNEKTTIAHSDGDALCHAIIDSLLGAANLGDIGSFYPEIEKNKDMSSIDALNEISRVVRNLGYYIVNVDATVILSGVRLSPFRDQIMGSLEAVLGCPVSVKFKSGNGIGEVGNGKAIEVHAVALLSERVDERSD